MCQTMRGVNRHISEFSRLASPTLLTTKGIRQIICLISRHATPPRLRSGRRCVSGKSAFLRHNRLATACPTSTTFEGFKMISTKLLVIIVILLSRLHVAEADWFFGPDKYDTNPPEPGVMKCYFCDPEAREVGSEGDVFSLLGPLKYTNREKYYAKGTCLNFDKTGTEKAKRAFRFRKTCQGGCISGKTEAEYTAIATYYKTHTEYRKLVIQGHFRGCFGPWESVQSALHMDECITVDVLEEEPMRIVHPDNFKVFIETVPLRGNHTICACNTEFCNRATTSKPSVWVLAALPIIFIL